MASGFHGKTSLVLFVEDNVEIRDLYANALRDAGVFVDEASTLEEASALAPLLQPDLVVLDRNLPDGDGWDLARELKQRESTRKIPVVAFTSNRGRADVELALVAGCDVFLEKPCTTTTFVRHVLALLELAEEHAEAG